MKKITINRALAAKKKVFTVLMLVASVFTVSARELHADLSQATPVGDNASWDAATNTFSWTAGNSARIQITDIVGDGDLSAWDTLVLVTENYEDSYRLDIELQDGTVIQGTSGWGKFYSAGTKKMALAEQLAEDKITSVKNIRINTNSGSGSIVIKDLYLLNDEAEPQYFEKVCQGFKAVKNNNKCSYDTTTHTFAWTAADANAMRIFKLNAGNLAAYQTLVLTTADFRSENEVGTNDLKYSILFMGENNTKIKEKSFASVGTKTIVLTDEMAADELASVVEIRFAGSCAQGSLVINPSDIKLIGEGEEAPVDDPDEEEEIGQGVEEVKATGKAYKTIENGQLIISRNGVHFDLTGKVVK